MTARAVATFNVGSSSLKFSLFRLKTDGGLGDCELRGAIRDLHGEKRVDLNPAAQTQLLSEAVSSSDRPADVLQIVAHWIADQHDHLDLVGIGHRVVHGGRLHSGPARASADVLRALDSLSQFAPAHQPHNLAGVRALADALPQIPQTLSFDTAFHRTMPRIAELYALPRELSDEGVIRFGFHGLSYAHIAETLPELLEQNPTRVLALHLGSGASASALLNGQSIATSMGLTALDGLPMATRCGDLDPGVVLHLIQDRGLSAAEVSDILYKRSGLLGVSGISNDTRVLLESDAPEAEEAIALYCYRVARQAGSLVTALGGLDAVVFSGGVGENAPDIRERIIRHLTFLGAEIDAARNGGNETVISADGAPISILRIEADEERIIARECASLL